MCVGAAIAVITAGALYAVAVAVAYRGRCERLEAQIRRLGAEPEDD